MARIRNILIDVQRIKSTTDIDNNMDDQIIRNAIWEVQEDALRPLIGEPLYDRLLTDLNSLPQIYKDLVTNFIWDFLTRGVLSYVVKTSTYKITNAGVVKTGSTDNPTISEAELARLQRRYQKDFDHYGDRLWRYLIDQSENFPEFDEFTNYGENRRRSFSTRDFYISPVAMRRNNNTSIFGNESKLRRGFSRDNDVCY